MNKKRQSEIARAIAKQAGGMLCNRDIHGVIFCVSPDDIDIGYLAWYVNRFVACFDKKHGTEHFSVIRDVLQCPPGRPMHQVHITEFGYPRIIIHRGPYGEAHTEQIWQSV